MKALFWNDSLSLQKREKPRIEAGEVLIKVAYAAICRTDLYVMDGSLKTEKALIPGHEFSGVIETAYGEFKRGDRVTVNPLIPCFQCELCRQKQHAYCKSSAMLGLQRNGAFAEYVRVPASNVLKIPANVSLKAAAYTEPIAASLAVFNASICSQQKGAVYGRGRLRELLKLILEAKGYSHVDYLSELAKIENRYDYLIETCANEQNISEIITALKPRALLIIKSRHHHAMALHFNELISKEIQLKAVNYASFEDSLRLLQNGLDIEQLIGSSFSLDEYEKAIECARHDEVKKVYFEIGGEQCAVS